MSTSTDDRIADTDPAATAVYAAEDTAATAAGVRRYTSFSELADHVEQIVTSAWWDEEFPTAPIEVAVERRSRSATFSAAVALDDAAVIAVVDAHHWSAHVVLHELAHVAAGPAAGHNAAFRSALYRLWRRHAGLPAATELAAELAAAGVPVPTGATR
jgi:putative metallohydrolase (TIGR04338 family)